MTLERRLGTYPGSVPRGQNWLFEKRGFQLRFAPMLLALKNAIASGLLGELDFDVYLVLDTPWKIWSFLEGLPRIEIAMHSIHCLDAIRQILGDPLGVHAKSIALVEAAYASSAAPATPLAAKP